MTSPSAAAIIYIFLNCVVVVMSRRRRHISDECAPCSKLLYNDAQPAHQQYVIHPRKLLLLPLMTISVRAAAAAAVIGIKTGTKKTRKRSQRLGARCSLSQKSPPATSSSFVRLPHDDDHHWGIQPPPNLIIIILMMLRRDDE